MAKANATGRAMKGRYVSITHGMFDSPAFHSLSPNAVCLYLHLLRRYNGFNNGEISFSCREGAIKLGISKDTAGKALQQLIDRGFVKIGKNSSFSLKTQKARRWVLTCWPRQPGTAPTNDWRQWKQENSEHGQIVCPVWSADNDKQRLISSR